MITQDAELVEIDLDENVTDEMLRAMADGLRAIQGSGIIHTVYKPYCIGGCRLAWREEIDQWVHAKDCLLARAIGVGHCCPEVLENLALVEECLEIAAQEGKTMNESTAASEAKPEEAKPEEAKPELHLCPHCKGRGKQNVLTPKGNKLECSACGNVFWASDPTWAKRNEVPR